MVIEDLLSFITILYKISCTYVLNRMHFSFILNIFYHKKEKRNYTASKFRTNQAISIQTFHLIANTL